MINENEVKAELKKFLVETLGIDENALTDDVILFGDGE